MNLNRREFLKQGGVLALFSALPQAFKVGAKAATTHVKKQVIEAVTKSIPLDVDMSGFVKSGIPIIDYWLSVDNLTQRIGCGCAYSMDGRCMHACDEGKRLIDVVEGTADNVVEVIGKHIDRRTNREAFREVLDAWHKYRWANADYRKHYFTGWTQGQEANSETRE